MVEVGSVSSALSFLRFLNLDLKTGTQSHLFSTCPFAIDPYALFAADVLMPLILLGELLIVFAVHTLLSKAGCCRQLRSSSAAAADGAGVGQVDVALQPMESRSENAVESVPASPALNSCSNSSFGSPALPPPFSLWNRYLATARSVGEFCFTQTTAACFRYLGCTSVAGASVVFAQPDLRCDSAEWRSTLVIVVLVLLLYVIAWPVGTLLVGWKQHRAGRVTELDAAQAPQLTRRRTTLTQQLFASSSSYTDASWFWSGVILLRRVIVLSIDSLAIAHYATRVQLFTLVHLCALQLQLWRRPFSDSRLNQLEAGSLMLLTLLSLVLGLGPAPFTLTQQILLSLLVLPPLLLFLCLALREVWADHGDKLGSSVAKITHSVRSKISRRRHRPSNASSNGFDSEPVTPRLGAEKAATANDRSRQLQEPLLLQI